MRDMFFRDESGTSIEVSKMPSELLTIALDNLDRCDFLAGTSKETVRERILIEFLAREIFGGIWT